MVIPETHDEDHTVLHGIAHLFETTLGLVVVLVSEGSLGVLAHLVSDGIVLSTHGVNGSLWMLNNLSILDELSSNLGKVAIGISVELSNNGKWTGGVNSLAFTIEVSCAGSEWIEITAILVADSIKSMTGGVVTAGHWILAFCLSIKVARMRCESRGDLVSLPDIKLGAAATPLSESGIGVSRRWVPVEGVGLSINELDVMRALSITVTSSIFGAGLVTIAMVSIFGHLDEVKSTIDTARHI